VRRKEHPGVFVGKCEEIVGHDGCTVRMLTEWKKEITKQTRLGHFIEHLKGRK